MTVLTKAAFLAMAVIFAVEMAHMLERTATELNAYALRYEAAKGE